MVDAAVGTLTIKDVRLEDKGNYVCVVNTTAQPIVISTNAHLYVESEYRMPFELAKIVPLRCK